MHINLNNNGSRSLDVELAKENNIYIAKKITLNIKKKKTTLEIPNYICSKTYEGLFRKLYEEFK